MNPLTTRGTRRMLLSASILVFLVGIQLVVLTEQTDRFFAWTIASPMTAVFLGSAYLASFALEFLASRRPRWADARIAVPAVLVFTTLTLIVTLLHLDRFHFDAPGLLTRFVTWVWMVVYSVVPPVMIVLLIRQVRRAGSAAPRSHRLPGWLRGTLAAQATLLLVAGVTLLLAPATELYLWPWPLTPLTAQAIAAWLIGLGIAAAQSVYENDFARVRVAFVAYLLFGVLQLIAVARYGNEIAWAGVQAWVYLAYLASTLVVGGYGLAAVRSAAHSQPRP